MKKILSVSFLGSCLLLFSSTAWSQQYVINGNAASLGSECFRLTPDLYNQSGSVWFQNKITLNADLRVEGTIYLGSYDDGADGIAFVLQPVCNGLGNLGGGIGYQNISPSLAIEFDTWYNYGWDPYAYDHIALTKNGDVDHDNANTLQGPFYLPNLENGSNHAFIIEWDADAKILKAWLDGVLRINYSADIVANIFSGNNNVFWGFTGATGAAKNLQQVCIQSKAFTEEGSYTVTQPSCPDFNNGKIDLDPAGGISPFTFNWSTGDVTEDIDGLTAGVYNVTVTDGNGCDSYFSITLTNAADNEPPVAVCKAITAVLGTDGTATITPSDVDNGSTDNCGIADYSLSQSSFNCSDIGDVSVALTVTDNVGLSASCSAVVTVEGVIPSCTITAIPGIGPFTGGPAETIYLGYGPQSVTLQSSPTGGSNFSYAWSGLSTANLSCTDCGSPVFTPTSEGKYEFTLTVTNNYGCTTTCSVTICVFDVRVPGTNGGKVYLCHFPPGYPENPQLLSISVNAVPAHITLHLGDHLGTCDQSCDLLEVKSANAIGELIVPAYVDFEIIAYPNPFNNEVMLTIHSESSAPASVGIYSPAGKLMGKEQVFLPDASIAVGSQLQSGMYILFIKQGDQVAKMKIVKL